MTATTEQTSPTLFQKWMRDRLMMGSALVVAIGYFGHLFFGPEAAHGAIEHFAASTFELMNTMWWGMALGILFVGLLDNAPRDLVMSALAGQSRLRGILRATAAGVVFDMCSHGILMVGMKLYERGASIGQTVAFLLASPWNSISLTVVLIALVGWWYTLAFILLSALIGVVTGWIFDELVHRGHLPDNPAREGLEERELPNAMAALRTWVSGATVDRASIGALFYNGLRGSRMVLRWLMFGIVLASAIRAFMSPEVFEDWFGPTFLGLMLTVLAATVIEVCSEGSTPIAADLVSRANAPGNGFIFLMTGVTTDYTEIMSIKDTTRSWKLALFLPLISLPQTIAIGVLLNMLG